MLVNEEDNPNPWAVRGLQAPAVKGGKLRPEAMRAPSNPVVRRARNLDKPEATLDDAIETFMDSQPE